MINISISCSWFWFPFVRVILFSVSRVYKWMCQIHNSAFFCDVLNLVGSTNDLKLFVTRLFLPLFSQQEYTAVYLFIYSLYHGDKMQYLIECKKPLSWCIIFQKSLLHRADHGRIKIGSEVRFLWPEDSPNGIEYEGKIIDISSK